MKEREPGQKPMYIGSEEITICGGRNEIIRGIAKVGEISKKVQENSLKWYGRVLKNNAWAKECW